jgi:pimeloyl-ACP methyl ester carboxylesterase
VHGFSIPYFIFDATFEFLTQSGFRVLRYDLFGRGFSDRPDTKYGLDLFVRQLGDLLDALHITRPISLAGLSAGGPVTAAFAARFPERVDKLVLIDPVGARPFALARLVRAASLPVLGEAIIGVLGSVPVMRIIASSPFDRERIGEFGPRYLAQMEYRGFKRALLSSIRNDLLGCIGDVYETIGGMGKPVLLFWGRQDATLPFRHSETLRALMPGMEFHAIENCGHIPHYEKPDEVNPILLRFLRKEPRTERELRQAVEA